MATNNEVSSYFSVTANVLALLRTSSKQF